MPILAAATLQAAAGQTGKRLPISLQIKLTSRPVSVMVAPPSRPVQADGPGWAGRGAGHSDPKAQPPCAATVPSTRSTDSMEWLSELASFYGLSA